MEWFLTQCSAFFGTNMPMLLSVALAGLIGSASHCSVMCSPLVASQMLELKETKQSQWYMATYHAGRITSYVALGVIAAVAGSWVFSHQLSEFSHIMMLIAGLIFIVSALRPRQTHRCTAKHMSGLQRIINALPSRHIVHYLRGVLMGFMPCGMVIAVLMLVSATHSPAMAAVAMMLFGLSTLPLLQLAGLGALRLGRKHPKRATMAGRGVMALNGCFLCAIGTNIVTVM